MKLASALVAAVILASSLPAAAAPLGQKSVGPDWGNASQAEKDAWIQGFAFKKTDADKGKVVACLDDYAAKPLFAKSDLTGVTQMCETIAGLE